MVTILCYIKNVARTHISISFITLGGTRKGAPTPSKFKVSAKSRSLSFLRFTTDLSHFREIISVGGFFTTDTALKAARYILVLFSLIKAICSQSKRRIFLTKFSNKFEFRLKWTIYRRLIIFRFCKILFKYLPIVYGGSRRYADPRGSKKANPGALRRARDHSEPLI